MTARQFATIVTRSLAVFTVIQAVAHFPLVFSMVSAFDKLFESSTVLGLVPPLLIWMPFFALAIWLWVKAAWFAERMLSGAKAEDVTVPGSSIDQVSIAQTAISVMGVYLVVSAVPQLFQIASLLAARRHYEQIAEEINAGTVALIVSLSTQLVIGFWLLFGSRGVARVIQWARSTGVAKDPETA